jgi:metallo-beta-lactamase family protein
VQIADGITLAFYEAGHILGSAIVALDIREGESGKQWRLVFSGDLGRPNMPIVRSPEHLAAADVLLMESTYGDRLHPSYQDAKRQLREIVQSTARRRGNR